MTFRVVDVWRFTRMEAKTRTLLRKLSANESTVLFMDGWAVPLWSFLESERGKKHIEALNAAGKEITLPALIPEETHGMPLAGWLKKYLLTILPPAVEPVAEPAPQPEQRLMFGHKEPKPRKK